MHNRCFRTCYRCKICTPSENSLSPWCPKLVTGLLANTDRTNCYLTLVEISPNTVAENFDKYCSTPR